MLECGVAFVKIVVKPGPHALLLATPSSTEDICRLHPVSAELRA